MIVGTTIEISLPRKPQFVTDSAYAAGNAVRHNDPSGLLVPEALVGGVIGGGWGVLAGALNNERSWSQMGTNFAAGFTTGFVIGLTDGASLVYTSAFAASVEAGRQDFDADGNALTIDGYGVAMAGAGNVLADGFGATSAELDPLAGGSESSGLLYKNIMSNGMGETA